MDLEEIQEELKKIFPDNFEGSKRLLKCMRYIFDNKSKFVSTKKEDGVTIPIHFVRSIAYLTNLPTWRVTWLKKKFIEELEKQGVDIDDYINNSKKVEKTSKKTNKKTDAKYSAKEVGDMVLKMISLIVLIKKEGHTKMTKELLERCGIPKEAFVDIVKNNEELKKYLNNLIIKNKSKK